MNKREQAIASLKRKKAIASLEGKRQTQESMQHKQTAKKSFNFGNMIENIPDSALQLGKNIVQPLMHPLDTANAIGGLALGGIHKFTPGIQPEEANIDAVGQMIKNRYGSFDNTLNTLENDPIGAMADVAGVLTGGSTLATKLPGKIGDIASQAGRLTSYIDPVNTVLKPLEAGVRHIGYAPDQLMESSAKFSTTTSIKDRKKMANTMLEEGILPTEKGAYKLTDTLDDLDTKIGDAVEIATNQGKTINPSRITENIPALKKKMGSISELDPTGNIAHIDDTVNKWQGNINSGIDPLTLTPKKAVMTPSQVQKLKVNAYKDINFDFKQGNALNAVNETRKTMANSAMKAMEEVAPELASLNKRYGPLREIQPSVERAAGRIGNRDKIGIGIPIKATAGAQMGGPAGAIGGGLLGLLDTPALKAALALQLHKLGKKSPYVPLLERQFLLQSGRLSE